MTLSAQKLKMRCAHKSDAAAVCAKLKAMSKFIAIDLYSSKTMCFISTEIKVHLNHRRVRDNGKQKKKNTFSRKNRKTEAKLNPV
jgi:hypothetical protein